MVDMENGPFSPMATDGHVRNYGWDCMYIGNRRMVRGQLPVQVVLVGAAGGCGHSDRAALLRYKTSCWERSPIMISKWVGMV